MRNIIIRPLKIEDALISYQWRNNPKIWEFTAGRPNILITKEIETDWIKKVIKDSSSCRFAILVDDVYVGNIQLLGITKKHAEYHIFIGNENYWGKGVSKKATQLILEFAKEKLKLTEVYLFVKKENISAVNLYLKSGFKYEDKLRGKMKIEL